MQKLVKKILNYFIADEYVDSLSKINLNNLQNKNIKLFLIDLDNTLIPGDKVEIPVTAEDFISKAKTFGFQICIFSNSINKNKKVKKVADYLEIPFIAPAFKPFRWGVKKALKQFNIQPENTVVIGDQLLTDVFGAKLSKLKVILVKPLSDKDFIITKYLNRNLEKIILNKTKGK